jgi:hypothetical protein
MMHPFTILSTLIFRRRNYILGVCGGVGSAKEGRKMKEGRKEGREEDEGRGKVKEEGEGEK